MMHVEEPSTGEVQNSSARPSTVGLGLQSQKILLQTLMELTEAALQIQVSISQLVPLLSSSQKKFIILSENLSRQCESVINFENRFKNGLSSWTITKSSTPASIKPEPEQEDCPPQNPISRT